MDTTKNILFTKNKKKLKYKDFLQSDSGISEWACLVYVKCE